MSEVSPPPLTEPSAEAHRLAAASLVDAFDRLARAQEAAERLVELMEKAPAPTGFELAELLPRHQEADSRRLIAEAARLARGEEPTSAPELPGPVPTGRPLSPVLDSLVWPPASTPPKTQTARPRGVPAGPLHLSPERFLPVEAASRDIPGDDTAKLLEHLGVGLEAMASTPGALVEQLAALAGRLLHAVPTDQPDVSLADEARITSAFAGTLGLQQPLEPAARRWRLLALGLGGIQRFIFRSVPACDDDPALRGEKGMARRLRARSFYVALLGHFAGRRVLDAVGLPPTSIIGDAGGRLLLLLPDAQGVNEQVETALAYLRDWFASELIAPLRLDVAMSAPLDAAAFSSQRFPGTFRELDARLAAARLDVPSPRLRTADGWAQEGWVASTDPGLPVDRRARLDGFASLGQRLPRASWLSLDDTCGRGLLDEPIEMLGYRLSLHEEQPKGVPTYRLRWDEHDHARPELLVAAHVPVEGPENAERVQQIAGADEDDEELAAPEAGGVLNFQHLGRLAADEHGAPLPHPMLGALKADVDLLGLILGHGLGEHVSFARLGGLSRSLDLFFKGLLPEQQRQRFQHIYTVFGGGDDLFLIGPWYDLVLLNEQLKAWFDQLRGPGSGLTLSAGLVFAAPHTPVHHLADASETALERAKSAGRNQITYGSMTCRWEQFHLGLVLHRQLRALAASDGQGRPLIGSSLVHRLLRLGQMARRSHDPKQASVHDLKWRAQLSYELRSGRQLDPARPDAPHALVELHHSLHQITDSDAAAALVIGASLTLYRLRGKQQPVPEETAS